MLVTGPSGAGKSTLFRAIAGIWPFGSGSDLGPCQRIADDAAAKAVFPDRVRCTRRWPIRAKPARSAQSRSGRCSTDVGLPQLASRLDDEEHWNRILSLGEQQRLGDRAGAIAGAAIPVSGRGHRLPRRTLRSRALPPVADRGCLAPPVVSIGHRATLERVPSAQGRALARDGDHFVLQGRETAKV